MSNRPLDDGKPINPNETEEGLLMISGRPVVAFEPSAPVLIETKQGYKVSESAAWIKFSTAFRERMLAQLHGPSLSVFMCICLHVNQSGIAWPGILTIAAETGYDRRTVWKSIKELSKMDGLMEITRQRGKANVYKPAFAAYGRLGTPDVPGSQRVGTQHVPGEAVNMYPEVEPVKQNQNIAPTAQTHRERVIAAIGRSQSVNDGLAKALRELTGLNLDRPSKTDQSYIAELRQWEATPAQCAHFAHYWQVVEKWRGEAARPALKTIRDRWEFAMAWSPAPVMATQFKDV